MKINRKQLKVKATYRQVSMIRNDQQKLDKAFDVLFDEVLKRRQEQKR